MNVAHAMINHIHETNLKISGYNEFKAIVLLTSLSVGMIQKAMQNNAKLNFQQAFGTPEQQAAFKKILQFLAEHDTFRKLYIEKMVGAYLSKPENKDVNPEKI